MRGSWAKAIASTSSLPHVVIITSTSSPHHLVSVVFSPLLMLDLFMGVFMCTQNPLDTGIVWT